MDGLTDPASPQFASQARELIKLIVDLRALGAEADLDLPRIALIGNQSAGKGSLVEAISGITVPRIRCPMECRLASSTTPWRCQVLLRRRGAQGSARETKFGPLLRSPAALEDTLRRAQLAVLYPTVPPAVFEALSDAADYAPPPGAQGPLAFSNDVVCVDIEGPGLPDLAFIDLPGIISTVDEGEAKSDIDAVTQMVRDHIKGNTLILPTISMRDDMNNQGAAHLARLEDPIGCRTIGVLTNPDLMQAGQEHGWLRILQGSAHKVAYGYFITKHPSPKELEERMSHAEAREREAAFFDTTPPWSIQPELRPRMGTPNLMSQLSNLLGALICRSIPELRVKAEESLEAVKRSLDRLPPPPSDKPMAKLLDILADLHASVQALVKGSEGSGQLLQQCRRAHHQLKSDVLGTAPRFRPFKSKDAPDAISAARSEPQKDLSAPPPLYLDDVRAHIRCSMTRQLPLNAPFAAKVALICVQRSVGAWAAHCAACLATVHAATRTELRALAQARLGGCTDSPLLADVLALLDDLIERHRARTAEHIRFQLELQEKPFTLNDGDFAAGREEYLERYRAARKSPLGGGHEAAVGEILERLAKVGVRATPADLAKLLPQDAYEEELAVMAETSAYFCIAYKSVVDAIPRVIDHGLLDALARDMHGTLVAGLALAGPSADARAARYLAEHPQVAAERTRLTQKRARLEAALQALRAFQTAAGPAYGAAPLPTADGPAAPSEAAREHPAPADAKTPLRAPRPTAPRDSRPLAALPHPIVASGAPPTAVATKPVVPVRTSKSSRWHNAAPTASTPVSRERTPPPAPTPLPPAHGSTEVAGSGAASSASGGTVSDLSEQSSSGAASDDKPCGGAGSVAASTASPLGGLEGLFFASSKTGLSSTSTLPEETPSPGGLFERPLAPKLVRTAPTPGKGPIFRFAAPPAAATFSCGSTNPAAPPISKFFGEPTGNGPFVPRRSQPDRGQESVPPPNNLPDVSRR